MTGERDEENNVEEREGEVKRGERRERERGGGLGERSERDQEQLCNTWPEKNSKKT